MSATVADAAMVRRALPPLPRGVRTLRDEESAHLQISFPDLPPTPADCPTCRGARVFRWYEFDSHAGRRTSGVAEYTCPCTEQWVLNRYLMHCGIGLAYQRLDWDDYTPVPPVQVIDYLAHHQGYTGAGMGFVLRGGIGTGKTLLAVLVLKRLIAMGYDGYLTSFTEMLSLYTDTFRDKEQRHWFARRVRNAGVLVIDDIGRESKREIFTPRDQDGGNAGGVTYKARPMAESLFEDVVRARVAAAKPTLITTNYTLADLRSAYNSNVFSLLEERCIDVEFHGADYRRTAQQQRLHEIRSGLTRPIGVW